jgi:molecular chaperone HscB
MRPRAADAERRFQPEAPAPGVCSPSPLLFVMPAISKDFYDFFGLDRKLRLDGEALQRRFYELSREWHPDRFTRKGADEQAQALEATAILNDGYRTLRDPVKRAEYLLKEEGFPIGEQRSKDVPAELLEEVFDLNMVLEELKGGEESARPQLEAAKENFAGMRAEIDSDLENLFAKHDAAEAQSETARQALGEIRGALNRRRYIENLIRDVNRALNPDTASREPLEERL